MSVGCVPRRRPDRFVYPAGYVGWVRVDYSVPNAPPLPIEDGCFLIKVPSSGRVQTSTPMDNGAAADEHYYEVDGKRQRLPSAGPRNKRMIQDGEVGKEQGRADLTFFVGTEAQWKSNPTRRPGNLNKSDKRGTVE
jgi:hypothetical protein